NTISSTSLSPGCGAPRFISMARRAETVLLQITTLFVQVPVQVRAAGRGLLSGTEGALISVRSRLQFIDGPTESIQDMYVQYRRTMHPKSRPPKCGNRKFPLGRRAEGCLRSFQGTTR